VSGSRVVLVTYRRADGRDGVTTVTVAQLRALRAAGRLVRVHTATPTAPAAAPGPAARRRSRR
jgi:hypothetical protein